MGMPNDFKPTPTDPFLRPPLVHPAEQDSRTEPNEALHVTPWRGGAFRLRCCVPRERHSRASGSRAAGRAVTMAIRSRSGDRRQRRPLGRSHSANQVAFLSLAFQLISSAGGKTASSHD